MNINKHRQAIVRTLILSLKVCRGLVPQPLFKDQALAFGDADDEDNDTTHYQHDYCIATGLFFPDNLSVMQTTYSNYGPIFMGLWLDDELKLDDDGDGLTLFPRWLAEVLNEECKLGIKEDDIYD